MNNDLTRYASLLSEIKTRIGQAQTRVAFSANREMLVLYWDIGQLITERQRKEGWGKAVIPRLSKDLRNEFPGLKGFSNSNFNRMLRFFSEYPFLFSQSSIEMKNHELIAAKLILPQPVAKFHPIDKKELIGDRQIGQPPVAQLNGEIQRPISISDHELTRALPDDLKSSLPTIEEIEQSLGPVRCKQR